MLAEWNSDSALMLALMQVVTNDQAIDEAEWERDPSKSAVATSLLLVLVGMVGWPYIVLHFISLPLNILSFHLPLCVC